jgi:transketolase
MAPRGNKGHFHGDPLDFLNGYIGQYIATAANAKENFWTDFFPAWDEKYPTLESTERKELEEEEESYQAEIDSMKKTNVEEVAKRGRRKAAIQLHPATSERLNELRVRAADRGVR